MRKRDIDFVYRELGLSNPVKRKPYKNGALKLRMLDIIRSFFPNETISNDIRIETHGRLLAQGEFSWVLCTESGKWIGGDDPISQMLKKKKFECSFNSYDNAYTITAYD